MASKPKLYRVTAQAGDYVAGIKVPKSGELMLDDEAAHFDLAAGNIERVKDDPEPEPAPAKRKAEADKG